MIKNKTDIPKKLTPGYNTSKRPEIDDVQEPQIVLKHILKTKDEKAKLFILKGLEKHFGKKTR